MMTTARDVQEQVASEGVVEALVLLLTSSAHADRTRVVLFSLTLAILSLPLVLLFLRDGTVPLRTVFGWGLGIVFFNPGLLETT